MKTIKIQTFKGINSLSQLSTYENLLLDIKEAIKELETKPKIMVIDWDSAISYKDGERVLYSKHIEIYKKEGQIYIEYINICTENGKEYLGQYLDEFIEIDKSKIKDLADVKNYFRDIHALNLIKTYEYPNLEKQGIEVHYKPENASFKIN